MSAHAQNGFRWSTGHTVIAFHLGLAMMLPLYFSLRTPVPGLLWAAALLFAVSGLGVTAGYHRCFAHRAYKPRPWLEPLLVFCATLAFQGSILRWAHDHRTHHRYVDTDRDPYSITKGWWNAHMGWMFNPPIPFDNQLVPDLLRNRLIMFQHRYHVLASLASNTLTSLAVGFLLGDYAGAFTICWGVRLLATYHATWLVNSAAHSWGERTYSRDISPVDNFLLGPLSLGEGAYHNFHHTFPNDWRNSYRWFHPDPTKWVLWTLARLRLVSGLKKTDELTLRLRLIKEDVKLLLHALSGQFHAQRDEWLNAVRTLSDSLEQSLRRIAELRREKKRSEERLVRREFRVQLRAWRLLAHEVLQAQRA